MHPACRRCRAAVFVFFAAVAVFGLGACDSSGSSEEEEEALPLTGTWRTGPLTERTGADGSTRLFASTLELVHEPSGRVGGSAVSESTVLGEGLRREEGRVTGTYDGPQLALRFQESAGGYAAECTFFEPDELECRAERFGEEVVTYTKGAGAPPALLEDLSGAWLSTLVEEGEEDTLSLVVEQRERSPSGPARVGARLWAGADPQALPADTAVGRYGQQGVLATSLSPLRYFDGSWEMISFSTNGEDRTEDVDADIEFYDHSDEDGGSFDLNTAGGYTSGSYAFSDGVLTFEFDDPEAAPLTLRYELTAPDPGSQQQLQLVAAGPEHARRFLQLLGGASTGDEQEAILLLGRTDDSGSDPRELDCLAQGEDRLICYAGESDDEHYFENSPFAFRRQN